MFGFKKRICPNCQCGTKVQVGKNIDVVVCKKCKKQGYIAIHCRQDDGKEFYVVALQHD